MKNVKLFEEFVNEEYNRYEVSLTKMINMLKEINKLYPDAKFDIPMGYNGGISTEEDLKGAIDLLKEHDKEHKKEKDPVKFYIWNIEVSNRPAGFLPRKIIAKGTKGFKDFSKKYSRQFENSPYITKISIGKSSERIENFGAAMAAGDFGPLD